jgi:hypothetical protein
MNERTKVSHSFSNEWFKYIRTPPEVGETKSN